MIAVACKSNLHLSRGLPAPRCSSRGRIVSRTERVQLRASSKDEADTGGPDDIESLFAQELKRRGLSSMGSADLDQASSSSTPTAGPTTAESPFKSATRTARFVKDTPPSVEGQRERSVALVNEGLEGLIPRASELLKLGGSVFLAFVPFILAISLMFGGIYSVMGEHFVHGGDSRSGPPAYIDPEKLLSEPTVDPFIPTMQ